jgi:hypothetical protein
MGDDMGIESNANENTNRRETMTKTRYAVRCEETQIDHVIFDTREEAAKEASEMTAYHGMLFEVASV